ncbi:MAG: MBL fold metallo-hydrolase [Deltaproteobacteria bacterium]|nr:MAG: MBL fold metallo-hydrolase [Deltaproteobacteria bacterium]
MDIRQIKLSKMATFCYLVGDEPSMTCALIDPAFDSRRILQDIKKTGYQVIQVINTHCHSDHTAGNAAIIGATGAKLLIHRLDAGQLTSLVNRTFAKVLGGKASPQADILLKDDDEIKIGKVTLRVIHTPGHTPGGISLYTAGHVFTGDTLFVGAVGRTDLTGGSTKQLLHSIQEKLYTLPGETRVWPGHDYGPAPYSTIEKEKRTNAFTRQII